MLTNDLSELLELDRRAVQASLDALVPWRPNEYDPPTPCTGWRLSDLVAHMTVQQHGFARAAAGENTALSDWAPTKQAEPFAAYRAACEVVRTAFARLANPATQVLLPELSDEPFPAATVVAFHLVDNVVHAWDVARSLATNPQFDDDLIYAARAVARAVPDDDRRGRQGSAFAHRLPLPGHADALGETLLLLGRRPEWRPQPPATDE